MEDLNNLLEKLELDGDDVQRIIEQRYDVNVYLEFDEESEKIVNVMVNAERGIIVGWKAIGERKVIKAIKMDKGLILDEIDILF